MSSGGTTNSILQAIPEEATDAQVADAQRPDRFVTTDGIVLKLKPVAPLLIMDAQKKFTEPVPPKIPNYEKGEGSDAPLEENPADPKYIREMMEYRQQIGELSNAIFLTRGTELVSVPDGIEGVDSGDWAEEVKEFANIDVPVVGRRRYYCWLKYVALTSMDDFQGLLNKLTSLGGITLEKDVADAETHFGLTRAGMALREYHLQKKFDADINISRRFFGEVPEYECREAAVYVHASWEAWLGMSAWDRACAVAHYRTHNSLEAHVSDAAEKASARKAARQARKRGRRS